MSKNWKLAKRENSIMCECLYVYCVMNTSESKPIGNRVFSTWAKADTFRKVLMNQYPSEYSTYYVESIEVDE